MQKRRIVSFFLALSKQRGILKRSRQLKYQRFTERRDTFTAGDQTLSLSPERRASYKSWVGKFIYIMIVGN